MFPAILGGATVTLASTTPCPGDYKLDSAGAYCAGAFQTWNGLDQYIEIKMKEVLTWVAIETQGRADADQWVTKYKIYYSPDGATWAAADSRPIMDGNSDRGTKVVHQFQPPILAQALRLVPLMWNGAIAMRLEAYHQPTPGDIIMLKLQEFLLQFGEQVVLSQTSEDLFKLALVV